MSSVFISYSHVDTVMADEVASVLTELDVDYFRDVKDINWGDSITSKVRDALDRCHALLVIISPASLKSHWVPFEIGHGSALRKIILPFLTHPSLDVPHYIRDLNHVATIDQVRAYFTNAYAADARSVPTIVPSDDPTPDVMRKLQQKMPELLAEMKQDLAGDESGVVREFFILPKESIPVNSRKPRFAYYEEQHDHLQNKIDFLEDHGLLIDVAIGNTPIYRMSEEFVELLLES